MNTDRVIGSRLFTDGAERPVSEDPAARQDVLGHDGEPVLGRWVPLADEPVVVEGAGRWGEGGRCGPRRPLAARWLTPGFPPG
jgi:hypothetical protein